MEASLHVELFETMWKVEVSQKVPDVMEDPIIAKRLRFALFVVVQLYELHRPRRTSSMDNINTHMVVDKLAGGGSALASKDDDDYASASSDDFDPRHLILESRRTEWTHRLNFVKRRLFDILSLLTKLSNSPSSPLSSKSSSSPSLGEKNEVSKKVLDALGFIIAGTNVSGERAARLSDALQEVANLSVESVSSWVSNRLVADENRNPQWSSFDFQANWSSSHFVPRKGAPIMVRGAIPNEFIAVPASASSQSGQMTTIIIVACHGACIVCLPQATHAHVIGCSDCIIYLGPIIGVLTIEHCERVRVVGPCGRVRLVNCIDTKINLWTGYRPLLLGDCRGIVAGPYCARYPNAKMHVESICSVKDVIIGEAWKHPILSDAGGVDEDDLDPSVFSLQSVDDFCFEPIAGAFFNGNSTLIGNLGDGVVNELVPIPLEYEVKMTERKHIAKANMSMIQDSIAGAVKAGRVGGAPQAKQDIHAAVQQAFREWLLSSGNIESVSSRFVKE